MGAVIALAIRALIQFAITMGLVELATRFVLPLINRAIEMAVNIFKVGEEEAIDIVANEYLIAAEQLVIGAVVLRAKTPTKIAERLGFTSKGWNKRTLKPATQAKVSASKKEIKLPTTITPQSAGEVLTAVAESRGFLNQKAKDLITILSVGVGLPTGVAFTAAQFIDFGSWESGAYTTQFQKILSTFGLEPDKAMPNSRVLSKDMWSKVLNVYRLDGATHINNPYTGITATFSVENLIELVDKVATNIVMEGGKPTFKNVIAGTTAFIVRGQRPAAPSGVSTPSTPSVFVPAKLPARTKTIFKPATNELTQLALDKVAEFLDAIPPRLDFEIASKSNPTDNDGNVLPGKYVILRVYLKSGSSVKNKFADLVLRPFLGDEKTLTSAEEEPIEIALRNAIADTPIRDALAVMDGGGTTLEPTTAGKKRNGLYTYEEITQFTQADVAGNQELAHLLLKLYNNNGISDERLMNPAEVLLFELVKGQMPKVGQKGFLVSADELRHAERYQDWKDAREESVRQSASREKDAGLLVLKTMIDGYKNAGLDPYSMPIVIEQSGLLGQAIQSNLHVRFTGSPDVFNRQTGKFIDYNTAKQLGLFNPGMVEQLTRNRPEVNTGSDYGKYSGKDLSVFPI